LVYSPFSNSLGSSQLFSSSSSSGNVFYRDNSCSPSTCQMPFLLSNQCSINTLHNSMQLPPSSFFLYRLPNSLYRHTSVPRHSLHSAKNQLHCSIQVINTYHQLEESVLTITIHFNDPLWHATVTKKFHATLLHITDTFLQLYFKIYDKNKAISDLLLTECIIITLH